MKDSTISLMIKRMLRDNRFDVCVVSDACEALGIEYRDNASYKFLKMAHCLSFEDLSGDEIMNIDFHLRSLFEIESGSLLLNEVLI